ncbi:MAG: hypothetical protein WBS33_19810, partial [Verrucomicrobiia bacterium]
MKLTRHFLFGIAGVIFAGAGLLAADVKSSNTTVATPPVYVPNLSGASGPLPDGVLTWDATTKETNVNANTGPAHFVFNFTNVATQINLGLATNITSITNFATVTNSSFWARLFGRKVTQVARVGSNTNVVTVTNSIAQV